MFSSYALDPDSDSHAFQRDVSLETTRRNLSALDFFCQSLSPDEGRILESVRGGMRLWQVRVVEDVRRVLAGQVPQQSDSITQLPRLDLQRGILES